jgi:3D (Asp-Asp-Asp) domain-containing protein
MKTSSRLSVKIIKRIVFISIILVCLFVVGVWANKSDVNYITIEFPEGIETVVASSSVNVQDILAENHIIILEDEVVYPDTKDNIDFTKTITISKITDEKKVVAEEVERISKEQILGKYVTITEKIVVEQVTIPYETITKNTTGTETDTTNKVLQQGKDGLKEVTYKIKYQNEVEIEKTLLSENIIEEPVNKIVQVQKNVQTSRAASLPRTSTEVGSTTATVNGETYKITAYCSCSKCCGKATGRTASGTQATAGRTVAAPAKFAFGTKLNIGGNVYTVEDRGGAIKGNRIDIYVSSHSAALQWGVRYLPVSVVE